MARLIREGSKLKWEKYPNGEWGAEVPVRRWQDAIKTLDNSIYRWEPSKSAMISGGIVYVKDRKAMKAVDQVVSNS